METNQFKLYMMPKQMDCLKKRILKNKMAYVFLLPSIILVLLFCYVPLWGVKLAFLDYNIINPSKSIFVGLKNFLEILTMESCLSAVFNTLTISLLNLLITFPITIIFALLLNELKNGIFKRTIQTVSYLPHFLSWISVVGIATSLLSKFGPVNNLIVMLTGNDDRTLFLAQQGLFVPMNLLINVWKGTGWGSIVFLAAITGVDTTLYEAASLDGAGRLKQVIHVTLPAIIPTIVIMLLWRVGSLFNDNFELIYGMQNPFIDFEVIQTLIYKRGIEGGNYSVATALGLMQGAVNFILLFIVNSLTKKITDVGLF